MPARKFRPSLSLSLLKDNLSEQCEAVIDHKIAYEREHREMLDERNRMIADLMEHGLPVTQLSKLTKLSRQQLYRIQTGRADE